MTLSTTEINTVICPASEMHPRQSEASILPLGNGRLLLGYTDFFAGDSSDYGPACIMGKWSHDEGTTWGEPFCIREKYGGLNIMEVSLLHQSGGRILCAYNRVETGALTMTDPIIHLDLILSDDEGKTWSSPQQISTDDIENMTTNDRFVRLSTGRILLPASGARNPVWISDDDGSTWRNGSGEHRCAAEPTVVELAEGTLKLYSRETSRGPARHLYVAESRDGGENWQAAPEQPLCSAPVPCMVKRVPDSNDLLMIWNSADHRTNLTAALSHDHGATWQNFRLLEAQDCWPMVYSHVYPSLTFSGGYAHITYWESLRHPKTDYMQHLIYRRLPISWFYEKRIERKIVH